MVTAGRAIGCDDGVGRCARESGAGGGNLDGGVEPAASARVLNSARRQLATTPRDAAPRAAGRDAETRARVRVFHLRSLSSLRGRRDLRRVRVRARPRVVPIPRARSSLSLRTIIAQSPLRSSVAAISPPRPEAPPLRALSRARSSRSSSTWGATTTAPGRRCFGRTASRTC